MMIVRPRWDAMIKIRILLTLAVLAFSGCDQPPAFAYSDEQLAMAIYHAEGGAAAQYPFGIRSVPCDSYANCKVVCKTTIKHNRRRFAHDGYKRYATYLDYLAHRYCPSEGRNLTPAERRLNKNWTSNVKYYLKKEQSRG